MQAPEAMYQPFETVSGTLTSIGFPCEGEEPCPTCLTIALVTDAKTYYLSTSDAQMQAQLDELEMQLPLRATISGTPFINGSFDFIKVQTISIDNSALPSLCDEWNVLEFRSHMGYSPDEYYTQHYRLTQDTIIICPTCYTSPENYTYVKLEENGQYKGALREGTNRDIYYIPAESTNVYLLYAFNAQVGDTLTDVWFGEPSGDMLSINTATIKEIKPTTPRIFVIDIEYWSRGIVEVSRTEREWIEGVGFATAPDGGMFIPLAGGFISHLLCAYKNGEQVYVSDWGEQYGCEYNYDPHETPTDTIPLYAQDDPGSSTVDPVDPNQVVATLQGDQLTIHEKTGVEVTYSLHHNAPAQAPAQHRAPQSDTFRNEVTIPITESGEYLLQLTNPSWGYTIFGRFNYSPQGIEMTNDQLQITNKVIKNGRLLILRSGKTYTLTGQEVK